MTTKIITLNQTKKEAFEGFFFVRFYSIAKIITNHLTVTDLKCTPALSACQACLFISFSFVWV